MGMEAASLGLFGRVLNFGKSIKSSSLLSVFFIFAPGSLEGSALDADSHHEALTMIGAIFINQNVLGCSTEFPLYDLLQQRLGVVF